METGELISVIIGVYNVAPYLERGLKSILNQTHKNLQIIIIDDASSDSSWDICKSFALQDSRIELIRISHQGLAMVRNIGIEQARGEYVAFFDPDDYVDKDYISTLYNLAVENEVKISVCNAYRESKYGRVYVNDTNEKYILRPEDLYKHMMLHCSFGVWDKLWHKSLLQNFKFNDKIRCGSDLDTYKIIFKVSNIAYYSKAKYHYMFNNSSISHTNTLENRLDRLVIVDEMIKNINTYNCDLLPYAYFLSCRTRRNFIYSLPRNDETNSLIKNEIKSIKQTYPKCKHLFSPLENFTFIVLLRCPMIFTYLMKAIFYLRLIK